MNLQNNSSEMKTVVETYVIEETAELIYDNEKLDRWNELVSELGLTGQTQIVSLGKSPIPFMHMKTGLKNIFKCLCPTKLDVEDYNITPIPVEILDLIALSKKEDYFAKIEIWYDEKKPDPVCIGLTGHYYQPSWVSDANPSLNEKKFKTKEDAKLAGISDYHIYFLESEMYLIGKWADVRASFEELKQRAIERYITKTTNELKKKIKEAQTELDGINESVVDLFN